MDAEITSRKDETAKLKGYPVKIKRAILKARDELLALSPEAKAIVKRALDGDAAALPELPQEMASEEFNALRELMAYSETINSVLRAALEAETANVITPDSLTGESMAVMIDAFKKLNQTQAARLAAALKAGNAAELEKYEQQLYAIVSFFISITDDETRQTLGGIFSLSADDLESIKTRVAPTGKVVLSPDDKQLLLPFDDAFMDIQDKPERLLVEMTQGMHTPIIRYAISKLAQEAPLLAIDTQENQEKTRINVIPAKGKREAIEISVIMTMPPEVTVNRQITLFDRMVEDAIGNLADDGYIDANGVMAITPEMVYRQINGLSDAENVSKTGVMRVNESMEKLAKTWCKIDCTDHLKAVGQKMTMDLQDATFGRAIILGTQVYLKFKNGREMTGWKITGRPLIYEYSKAIKQIATVDRQVLTAGAISNTPEVMLMRYYLLQQIERIRNKPGTPGKPDIIYDSIFTATGDTLPMEKTGMGRKTRMNRIKAIHTILNSFKKTKHIEDWREVGTGNRGQKTGVEIDMKPPKTDAKPKKKA